MLSHGISRRATRASVYGAASACTHYSDFTECHQADYRVLSISRTAPLRSTHWVFRSRLRSRLRSAILLQICVYRWLRTEPAGVLSDKRSDCVCPSAVARIVEACRQRKIVFATLLKGPSGPFVATTLRSLERQLAHRLNQSLVLLLIY